MRLVDSVSKEIIIYEGDNRNPELRKLLSRIKKKDYGAETFTGRKRKSVSKSTGKEGKGLLAEQLLRQKEGLEQAKYLMGLLQDKLRDKERGILAINRNKAILQAEKEKVELIIEGQGIDDAIKNTTRTLREYFTAQVHEQMRLQEELTQQSVEIKT